MTCKLCGGRYGHYSARQKIHQLIDHIRLQSKNDPFYGLYWGIAIRDWKKVMDLSELANVTVRNENVYNGFQN